MTIDTANMCSHLQKKLFEEDGIYHSLWIAMQDDGERRRNNRNMIRDFINTVDASVFLSLKSRSIVEKCDYFHIFLR